MYHQAVEAYRDKPGVHEHAAKRSGLSARLVRDLWETGRQDRAPFARCIKDALAEERSVVASVRSNVLAQLGVVRDKATAEVADVRLAEAMAVEIQRRGLVLGARTLETITGAFATVAPAIAKAIENMVATDGTIGITDAAGLIKLFETTARAATMVADATEKLVRLEREIAGDTAPAADSLPSEEAAITTMNSYRRLAAFSGLSGASGTEVVDAS